MKANKSLEMKNSTARIPMVSHVVTSSPDEAGFEEVPNVKNSSALANSNHTVAGEATTEDPELLKHKEAQAKIIADLKETERRLRELKLTEVRLFADNNTMKRLKEINETEKRLKRLELAEIELKERKRSIDSLRYVIPEESVQENGTSGVTLIPVLSSTTMATLRPLNADEKQYFMAKKKLLEALCRDLKEEDRKYNRTMEILEGVRNGSIQAVEQKVGNVMVKVVKIPKFNASDLVTEPPVELRGFEQKRQGSHQAKSTVKIKEIAIASTSSYSKLSDKKKDGGRREGGAEKPTRGDSATIPALQAFTSRPKNKNRDPVFDQADIEEGREVQSSSKGSHMREKRPKFNQPDLETSRIAHEQESSSESSEEEASTKSDTYPRYQVAEKQVTNKIASTKNRDDQSVRLTTTAPRMTTTEGNGDEDSSSSSEELVDSVNKKAPPRTYENFSKNKIVMQPVERGNQSPSSEESTEENHSSDSEES
jgi:hypothetical protein